MNEEVLRKLYDNATSVFDLPSYEEFKVDMQDLDKLSRFRESMSEHFDIPDLETFKADIGFVEAAPGPSAEIEQTTTERVGGGGGMLGGLQQTDDEVITSDITPQEGVETITEDVKYDETEGGGAFDLTAIEESRTITYDANATPFERSLAFVNRDLFRRDEKPVVHRLNYHFNDYGFTFEESGILDNVTVTAPNGKQEEFAIDSWFVADNSQEARALRDFMRTNQDASILNSVMETYDASKKKYFSNKAYKSEIASIQKSSADLVRRQKTFFQRKAEHDRNMERFANASNSAFEDPEFEAAYQREIEEGRYLAQLQKTLTQEYTQFSDNSKLIDEAVGNYTLMKQKDGTALGTFFGNLEQEVVGYFDAALSTIGGTGIEAFYNIAQSWHGNDYGMSDEEYRLEFIRAYEGYKGVEAPEYAKESEEGFVQWVQELKDTGKLQKEEERKALEQEIEEGTITMRRIDLPGLPPENLQGGIFDQHIIHKDDPRLSRLPNGVYDIRKGVKFPYGSRSVLGLDQPMVKYDKPQVWSISEEDWVDAPRVFGQSNIFDQIDVLVGDQRIKQEKKGFKDYSRHFFTDLVGVSSVSEERVQAQKNQPGWKGIVMSGIYGAFESAPALAPMVYQAIKNKGKVKVKAKDKKLLKRIAQSLKAWATDGYRQSSLIAMSLLHADKLNQQMENNPEFEWVTESEKKSIVLPLAITSGILETLGFRNLLQGTSGTQLIQSVTAQALSKLPKGATPTMFRRAVVNIMDNRMTRAIGSSGVYRAASVLTPAALAEAETGLLQEFTDIEGKNIYNAIKGKDLFKNPDRWSAEYFKQLGHAAAAEAVGGFTLATPGALINAAYGGTESILITDEMVELFDSMKDDDTYVEAYKTKLDLDVAQGLMSKIEAKTKLEQFNVLRSASTDLDMAGDLSKSQKKKALELIFRKKQLQTEMEGMDSDLGVYKEKQDELEIIKLQLGEIGSQEAQNKAKLKKEQEGIPVMVTEDEAIEELKKEGVENPTPEQIKIKQDALQKSSTTQMDAQESSEGGSQVGKGLPKSESTDKGKKGIKSKTKSLEDQDETQEEVDQQTKEDIDAYFDETLESNEVVTPNISRNKGKQPSNVDANKQTTIIKNAKKAAQSVLKLFPKVRIVIHDNAELFKKATGREGRGYFSPSSKTIHINMEKANKSTPFHEAVHAIANELINTDAAAKKVFGRMLLSLNKVLPNEGNLKERIDKFTKKYNEEEQNEEAVSELFGILASEYRTLTKPKQNKVISLINRFLKKLGIASPFSEGLTKSDEAVIDFLNTVAGRLGRGEAITEEDVLLIEEIKNELDATGTAPIGNPTTIVDNRKGKEQKVRFDGVYENSLVTPENEIDIDALLEDIESKNQKVWFWMADQLGIGTVEGVELDGGPSYALVPEHQAKNIIWASGLKESTLAKNSQEADYIFIVSGSPQASKLANKKVFDLFVSKLGSFEDFKNKVNNFAKPPIKVVKETLEEYNSWEEIRDSKNNKVRKQFLAGLVASQQTPQTELHKLLKEADAFIDLESLRDGFYKANNFQMNDVMLVLKPEGVGKQSDHSTYTTDILGEVVGIPNKKINAFDILPASMKATYDKVLSAAQMAQVVAPYGSGVRTIETTKKKSTPPKSKPKRRGKEQKTLEDVISQTQMDVNGYYSKFADMRYLQREFDEVGPGYKVKRAKINQYGQGGGVYVLKPRGGMVKPKDQSRRGKWQKLDAENEAIEIVMKGREGGFKNDEIKYYMKKRGFKSQEINEALKVDDDLFSIFPKSFGNIEGGLKKGVAYLNKINDYYKKLAKANNRKTKNKKSNEELVNETIEYMYTTDTYINEGGKGSRKTAQQQAMEVDVLNYLSPDTSARNGLRVKNLNESIRNIKWAQEESKRIQRRLRQYIRSVIPRNLYSKSEVISLIDKINAVTEENYAQVVQEVTDKVTEITNKYLDNTILDILNKSYEKVQSGRLKGTSISKKIKDRINKIQENIIGYVPGKKGRQGTIQLTKDYSQAEIDEANKVLLAKIQALEKEEITIQGVKQKINRTLTPEEAQEVADLSTAIAYNNTLSMDQKNPLKTNAYEQILFGLTQLQSQGVSALELQYLKDATTSMNNTLKMLREMGVSIDPEKELRDEGKTNITQGDILAKFKELKKKIKTDKSRGKIKALTVKNKLALVVKENIKAAERYVFGRAEDLTGLMDRVSLSTGELFGGFSQEMVTKEIRKASRTYKGRMLRHELALSMKMTELYGKRWMKYNRNNTNATESIIISQAKQDILEKEEARIKADSKMESGEKEVLLHAIYEEMNRNNKMLSQNELLYFRNQGLDPSLEASFEQTFLPTGFSGELSYLNKEFNKTKDNEYGNKGEYKSRIKEEIDAKLDDRLKVLGDWMIQEFFPNQYDHYNKTYQAVYKADMPWNRHYAGRLYRAKETDIVGLDLLAGENNQTWMSNVSAASTKFRQENASAIRQTDAVDGLLNYIRDMEYFAAYAIPVRNINKVFSDSAVKEVIAERFGNDINTYIAAQIEKIANKGAKNQKSSELINFFNTSFLLSRLGMNPTLILKQMTSFVTYGNDIGYDNWIKYAVATNWKGDLKEIMDNSIVLQDRYGKPITRVIETYQDKNFETMSAKNETIRKYFNRETQNKFVNILMSFTMLGDKGAIMLGGLPNYRFYKAKYFAENENATEQDAIDYAIKRFEADTLRTQQSYDLQDKDYYQTGNVYERALNMFLTTPKQYLRREIIAARNFSRLVRSGGKQGKGTKWQNARTFMVYHFLMPTLFRYVSLGLPGLLRDKRDDDDQELFLAMVMGNLNALYVLGDIMNVVKDTATGKPWAATPSSIPIFEQAATMSRLWTEAAKTKDPIIKADKEMRFWLELTTLVGIPGPQLKRLVNNYMALADGPEDMGEAILRLFSFSDYIRKGQKTRAKKDKPATWTRKELKKYFPEEYKELLREEREYEIEYADELRELEIEEEKARREYEKELDEYFNYN